MLYKIADFFVKFNNHFGAMLDDMKPFLSDEDKKPDIEIEIDKETVEKALNTTHKGFVKGRIEGIFFHKALAEWLPYKDAFVFHAAAFDIEKNGIMLAALSGTGKTTLMLNFKSLLGDKMEIINGDKPIIRYENGEFYAYGTPFSGKEHLGSTGKTKLKALMFIKRGDENFVKRVSANDMTEQIINQIYLPENAESSKKTLFLVNEMLKSLDLYEITCTKDISAAKVALNEIFKEKEK